MQQWIRDADGGAELLIHVQPGARRSGVAGTHGDALKIAVREKATGGAANRAVCELVADLLEVPRSTVELVSGHRSRRKRLRVGGVDATSVEAAISGLVAD